jgi:hypothetical protein
MTPNVAVVDKNGLNVRTVSDASRDNGNLVSGMAIEQRKQIQALIGQSRKLLQEIE